MSAPLTDDALEPIVQGITDALMAHLEKRLRLLPEYEERITALERQLREKNGTEKLGDQEFVEGAINRDGSYTVAQSALITKDVDDLQRRVTDLERRPTLRYCGVWDEKGVYDVGAFVTWGGSLWHSNVNHNRAKPGTALTAWTLSAKRGADGKSWKAAE